jgi:hypothetical protein
VQIFLGRKDFFNYYKGVIKTGDILESLWHEGPPLIKEKDVG